MAVLNLAPHFRHEAQAQNLRLARLLEQGRGFDGRRLRAKDRPDGKRLGGDLPRLLRSGRVFARGDGFVITYDRLVTLFHRGVPQHSQPPRPIVGLPSQERAEITRRTASAAAGQIQQAVRRAGR